MDLLDEGRRKKVAAFSFRQESDMLRSLAGGLLMRHIANGKTIGYTEKGKPFIVNDGNDENDGNNENNENGGIGRFFNIAHSGDYAVAVVSETAPVGIDIENTENRRGGNFLPLAKKTFHPEEFRYFSENPDRRRFYEIWTQKEAFVKMKGACPPAGLKSFSVLSLSRSNETGHDNRPAFICLFRELDPYIIAVCAAEPVAVENMILLRFPAD
jgi:phosphopantetheinyl transferase